MLMMERHLAEDKWSHIRGLGPGYDRPSSLYGGAGSLLCYSCLAIRRQVALLQKLGS